MFETQAYRADAGHSDGTNVFVRTLAIVTTEPGVVSLAMEDTAHAFQVSFSFVHDRITGVQAVWHRHPLSSCGGATDALQQLVGLQLGDNLFDVSRQADRFMQCTHMFDMLCLGVVHAFHRREDRRYDVVVPALAKGSVVATLTCNGRTTLELELEDYHRIVRPKHWQGVSVLKGYLAWVGQNIPADEREYHFIMQKALFVAQAQKHKVGFAAGTRSMLSGMPAGTCFGSQPERYADSVKLGTARKFTKETAGDVIRFFRAR